MSEIPAMSPISPIIVPLMCPVCHTNVRPTDFYCYNCGKNLHSKALSTSFETQFILYLKCLVLPPLGIIWGWRYLRQSDQASKIVGLIAITITVAILVLAIQATLGMINAVNSQLGNFSQNFGGF